MGRFTRSILVIALASIFFVSSADAKTQKIVKADKDYDWKAVQNIVYLPVTSKGVTFGKVDKKRLPKIKALLEKTKIRVRKQMVDGMMLSKPNKKFYYSAPDSSSKTLLVKQNIELFDNGNMATRTLSPFGGSAKVTVRVTFLDAKSKKVRAELLVTEKGSGGVVGGGMDSEALYMATNISTSRAFTFMKKQTGLTYSSYSNFGKKAKMGTKDYGDSLKEEKKEEKIYKDKSKEAKKKKEAKKSSGSNGDVRKCKKECYKKYTKDAEVKTCRAKCEK